MKKFAILAIAALVAGSAFAQGIGGGGIYVNGDWYRSSDLAALIDGGEAGAWNNVGSWMTGTFNDLGTISSLSLGGNAQTYGNDYGSKVEMIYSIDNVAASPAPELSWYENIGPEGGQNGHWQSGGADWAPVDVDISGLSAGDHNLAVQFKLTMADGTTSFTDSVSSAKFTIAGQAPSDVPEPATMSLLGLGALALVLRRKLRK